MTSKRILDRTRFSTRLSLKEFYQSFFTGIPNLKKFLPIYKNFAPKVYGNTFYENMKYYHDLGLESRFRVYSEDGFVPEYEYVFFDNCTEGVLSIIPRDPKMQKRVSTAFSLIKQHHLFGVYKIPEATPIKQVRNELLLSLYDKILGLDSCCTFLCFINRIDAEHISIELFLFGISDLDDLVLADILFSPFLINCRYARLDPHNAMYWFYKFHIFIYHNPAILSGASCLIALDTKSNIGFTALKLFNTLFEQLTNTTFFLYEKDFFSAFSIFEYLINDTFRDCTDFRDSNQFLDFMQVGTDPQNTQSGIEYTIQFSPALTDCDRWWGINKGSYP